LRFRSNGFTIFEFIIVLGIIMSVVLLMMPVVSKTITNAVNARCMGNLNAINRSFEQYRQVNKGRLPFAKDGALASFRLVTPYLPDIDSVLDCPGSGISGSYSYDPGHHERDYPDTIVFGDSPAMDEIRNKYGVTDNHDGLGGYYLRMDGSVGYIMGSVYRRNRKFRNIPLVDCMFDKDSILTSDDTYLQPMIE